MQPTQLWIREQLAKERETLTRQVGGDHYRLKIQPIDFIVENEIPFREANIIKYVVRHKQKGKAEDLKKARHYIDMLIEEYENESQ